MSKFFSFQLFTVKLLVIGLSGSLLLIISSKASYNDGESSSSSAVSKTISMAQTKNSGSQFIEGRLWGIKEQEIEYLFKTCKDLVCIVDNKGYFQRINVQGAHILGWEVDEILGKSSMDLIHSKYKQEAQKYLTQGQPTTLVNRYRRKDGSYCWLDWVALPDLSVPASEGHPILFARDVTLQKTLEKKIRKALKVSAQELGDTNKILDIVIHIQTSWIQEILEGTPERGKSLKLLLKNLVRLSEGEFAFLGYFKSSAANVELLDPIFYLSPTCSPEIKLFFKTCQEQGKCWAPFENIFQMLLKTSQVVIHPEAIPLHNDSALHLKSFIGLPLSYKQEIIGVVGLGNVPESYCSSAYASLQPLTLLASRMANEHRLYKETETQRVAHLESIETFTEAKTAFIAHMSHEIRTPLTGVIGLLELINKDDLNAENAKYVQGAESASLSLLSLLNDVLDISKIEAGQLKLENVEFNPFRIVQEITQPFSLQAEKKGIIFSTIISPEIPDILIGDPTRLRQIFSNLINNALKFTEHGKIKVTLKSSRKGKEQADKREFILCGSVKDTGIGISAEAQQSLFKPFTQADSSTSRRFGGSGLGLTIVKKLCKLMGGTISLKSHPHEGSDFKFMVVLHHPKSLSVENAPLQPTHKIMDFKGLHVLLAEDNTLNQIVVEKILTRQGCLVTIVENGVEALKAINTQSFDVVLMDGQMPEMDGLEATRQIRKTYSKKALPIIAVTAHAMREEEEKFFEAGVNGYVTKPVQAKTLLTGITKCLMPDSPKLGEYLKPGGL